MLTALDMIERSLIPSLPLWFGQNPLGSKSSFYSHDGSPIQDEFEGQLPDFLLNWGKCLVPNMIYAIPLIQNINFSTI